MTESSPTNLVDPSFWEDDYFSGVSLPSRPDMSFAFNAALAWELERVASLERGQSVIEVGCAPASWLVWYAEKFGAMATGIEYTPKGAELSRRNLAAAGVQGEVREGDFLSPAAGAGEFDLVLSLGFIEHFDDLETVFARHLDFLKPGGRLFVGVPNYRGLIGLLQRWGDPALLALHNLEAMRPELYRGFAQKFGLTIESLRYIGGIDPTLVRVSRRGPAVAVLPLIAMHRVGLTRRVRSPWLSSYLTIVLRKPV